MASCSESVVKTNKLGNTKCHTHALQKNMLHSCSVHTRFHSPQPCVLKVRTRHFVKGGQMLSVLWQHLKELLCGCSSKTANICETVSLHWVAVRRWFTTTRTMMRKQQEVSFRFVYFSVYLLVLLWETRRSEKMPKCRLHASHGAPFWGAVRPCLSSPTGLISATKGSGQHLIWRGEKKSHVTPEKSQM